MGVRRTRLWTAEPSRKKCGLSRQAFHSYVKIGGLVPTGVTFRAGESLGQFVATWPSHGKFIGCRKINFGLAGYDPIADISRTISYKAGRGCRKVGNAVAARRAKISMNVATKVRSWFIDPTNSVSGSIRPKLVNRK